MKLTLLVLGLMCLASASSRRIKEEKSCSTPVETNIPDCDFKVRMWAFNTTSQQCERFELSGCTLGIEILNLYDTKHECMTQCDRSNPRLNVEAPSTDKCFLPTTKGIIQCLAYFEMWTFDASAPGVPSCVKTVYGGCAGTDNLFDDEARCTAACGDAVTKIQEQCPARELVSSCNKFCSGDRDCDEGEVCCPSHSSTCGTQCVPVGNSSLASSSAMTVEERTARTLKTRAICEQPIQNGSCSEAVTKFAFKPEKNRCEIFLYGGCEGNDNNFDSASECQTTCGGDIPNEDITCASVECDAKSARHYKNRNCIPQYAKGACCPTSYLCEDYAQAVATESETPICLYKRQSYEVGAKISAMTEDDPCLTCTCSSNPAPFPPSISCETEVCPLDDDVPDGCALVTVPGQCCPSFKCGTEPLATCNVSYVSYEEGEVFRSSVCRTCVCTANYTDSNGYGCSDVLCLREPPSPDCVPVYDDRACCPVSFHCPTDELTITRSTPKPVSRKQKSKKPFSQSDCLLSPRKGKCRAFFPMYYYDAKTLSCKEFVFGGCDGNWNRFGSQEECEERCSGVTLPEQNITGKSLENTTTVQDVCELPQVPGPCQSSIPSYYYDQTQGSCKQFLYGGCKGNGNRFRTLEECQQRCAKPVEPIKPNPELCNLPKQTGKCRASGRNFFFNSATQRCEVFTYGGCGGNDNNFAFVSECTATCKPTKPYEYKIPDYCSLPGDTGPCKAKQRRVFYDSVTGKCKNFTYGGCEGNLNRFFFEDECEYMCKPEVLPMVDLEATTNTTMSSGQDGSTNTTKAHCALPPDQGFCLAFRNRFYYNPETSKCEQFVYGGCKGNANNFRTEQQCMDSCGKQSNETVILPEESVCRFGNMTVKRGDPVLTDKLCIDCICLTPPDITCSNTECL